MTTLQETLENIDGSYPVAGQDNNTQGFRDNFTYIQTSLRLASEEIIKLQNNTVKVADLESNESITNNMAGSTIINGFYSDFHGVSHIVPPISGIAETNIDIDVTEGPLQQFTLIGETISTVNPMPFTFINWPGDASNSRYGCVRLHFSSDGSERSSANLVIVGSSSLVGKKCTIENLGIINIQDAPTVQAMWNTMAGTTGKTYAVGDSFTVVTNGVGNGTVSIWRSINFYSGTTILKDPNLSLPLLLDPAGTVSVIEAWSFDGGTTTYVRSLGNYSEYAPAS